MKRHPFHERGTAAMEMTVVLFFTVILLGIIVLFGRLTWHATALAKGVSSTTRILATLPRMTLVDSDAVETIVRQEVRNTTLSAGLDLQPLRSNIDANCGTEVCRERNFDSVSLIASITFHDTIFGSDLFPISYAELFGEEVTIDFTYRQTYVRQPDPPSN